MGLIQSTATAPEPAKSTEVVQQPSTTTETTEVKPEMKTETPTEKASEVKIAEITATPNSTPLLKPMEEEKGVEVLERYIEPPGTKVEVAPVDVAPAGDVVKKNKKKNKKNKD